VATPPEKIVIVDHGPIHGALSRARLLATVTSTTYPASDNLLTTVGRDLVARIASADGVEVLTVLRHGIHFKTVHPALWSWDEVEQSVVAAFAEVLGTEVEVIREGGV
jgi:hypothetical protein